MTTVELETARGSALLTSLPEGAEDMLLRGAEVQDLRAGQILFLQNEPAEALFIVLGGLIKLYRSAASGTEAVIDIMSEGQSFGEAAALCGQLWPVSAEAVDSARLLRLDAGHVRLLLKSNPLLAMSMLAPALLRLEQLILHIEELKALSSLQRAAEFLLALSAECDGRRSVALPPCSKALIAHQLGMKPETLSRAFARLRDHGVQIDAATAHIEDVAHLRDISCRGSGLIRAAIWRSSDADAGL